MPDTFVLNFKYMVRNMKMLIKNVFGAGKPKYSAPKLREMSVADHRTHSMMTDTLMERIERALFATKQHALIFGEFQTIDMLKRGRLAYAVAAVAFSGMVGCTKNEGGGNPQPAPVVAYNDDADLWANTATLTVENGDAGVSVRYRQAGQTSWLSTTDMGEGKFLIEPVYQESPAKDKVLAGKVALSQTGVRLGGEYEAVAMSGGNIVASTQFKVGGKRDVIPNAGMDDWSKYSVEGLMVGGEVSYPNKADDEKFWVSGSNKQTPNLCSIDTASGGNGAGCAMLKGATAFGIFAAGNLFTGDMAFGTGLTAMGCGYARFGQKYTFTARPLALKVRLKAHIGTITHVGANDPGKDKEHIKGQTKDVARIYFCITDWRERHTVQGGMQLDKNTLWNPAEQNAVSEGKILGYGLADITADTADWEELTIPIIWYDTAAKPTAGNYSLVISAASSAYGDYLTGSTESSLCVEDFEWVY